MPPTSNSSTSIDTSSNSLAASLEGTDLSNLYRVIDRDKVHGLNLTVPEDAKQVIKPWDERDDTVRYLESNVDDQLMLHIPFVETVRIKSIVLKLGRGELTPRHLRIYTNRPTIPDFSETEGSAGLPPQLNLSLLEGETGVVEYPLRVAAFTSVHSLSLLFDTSSGGTQTRIYFIGFRGDMRSFRRGASSMIEVPTPHAADSAIENRAEARVAGRQTTAR